MAVPLLALGKIVSSVVSASAKGLTVAGKATAKATAKGAKVVGRAAGKAARAGGELAIDTASAAKKGLIKGIKATPNALKKAASSTRKIMSDFGKRMSRKKTSAQKLKRDAQKIKSKLTQDIKKVKKQRLDRERLERNVLERKEIRNMERNIKSSKTPTGKKVESVLKSPMSIIDKIFGLGSILLTGIVVNAIDDIIKKFKEFKENNQGLFDNIGKILTVIKDSFVSIFDSITKPFEEEGSFDGIAKFDDDGNLLPGNVLYNLREEIKKLGPIVEGLKKVNPFVFDEEGRVDLKTNIIDPETGEKLKLSDTFDTPQTKEEYLKESNLIEDKDGNLRDKDTGKIPLGGRWIHKWFPGMQFDDDSSSITPIKKNNNIGDQSFNTDGDTTLMIAFQKEIEYVPFPIGNSGSSGGSSSSNQSQKLSAIWNT